MASDKIKVAVRVRPFSKREMELGTACVVDMDTARNQTILHHPLEKDRHQPPKTFAFDHCFKSLDTNDPSFASQEHVFDCVGQDILNNALKGYNACIFAYGQTGSGKSYSMMGTQKGTEKGIIPRLCDSLFERIESVSTPENEAKVEVSYMEIYNEKVHDLLDLTSSNKSGLKVREHNVLGPYVDGLSQLAVISYQEIDDLMIEGNKSRTVAATNMNNESSRSHAVFTIILTFTLSDPITGTTGEKVSRMSLVDLAGSERAVKTGAVGERLKEGSNINRSLTTLGLVISKLAEHSTGKSKDKFVPYRDSVLTWLLKDNLGGNSKTVMVATISPSGDNYEETLSTLRYADRAKKIVNHAVVNEDPNARIIRELRGEVEMLKEMLLLSAQPELLKEKLSENEKLMKEMSLTWEEKLHKTEQKQEDRRHALEKMGISIQSSGIKVEKNKYFLVNLNADPSLNELLVYYLKECTLVGRAGTTPEQDIQLMGLGIQAEHCIIQIENTELYITPLPGARTCINGSEITSRIQLGNGDRILWGSNHFFRVNCPKSSASSCDPTPTTPFDWKMAQEEVMMEDVGSAPMKDAMARLERQYEEDKQTALENQRKEYEKQFQQLKNFMSPSTPFAPFVPYDPFRLGKVTPSTPTVLSRLERWGQDRDEMFKRSLNKLREDIIRANGLVREANSLADEMDKATSFSVTLQIPPHNLSPNRKRGAFVSEPAILVKRKLKGSQVWSMEKLESKLIDMRELYVELKSKGVNNDGVEFSDPFYEETESHNLIGVANIFLDVLFDDVRLDYHTPIISQQGEVAGRLQIEIQRIGGSFPNDRMAMCETNSESSEGSSSRNSSMLGHDDSDSSSITCKVTIKGATGLPPSLSHFVFCQYMFWGDADITVVPPVVNTDSPHHREYDDSATFRFDYTRTVTVNVTEEFIEHCSEGALSIEVYGHRSTGFANAWEAEQQRAKARSLADRWSELTRKLEFRVEVQELNEAGEYSGVEVHARDDVGAGGVLQLRQGQQRRILAWVKPVHNSGTLPIICESISSIAVGGPVVRSKLQKPLDSYQEEDLAKLRERWSEALGRRRQYLDGHIQKYINKGDKTDAEVEREQSLVEQWVCLTDERNAVLVPSEGAGVPGAPTPTDWDPKPGMETHSPVLFLDLNADDFSTGYTPAEDQIPVFGHNSILPKEHGGKFFNLPIIRYLDKEVGAVASWDSSVHDSVYLNRITQGNERAYLIVKAVVRLSHPCSMDLVLRKRLCLNIFKRHSITDKIRRKIVPASSLTSVGVVYEIVSNVPKASEELEDRESLAVMAASGQDLETGDGDTFIEKYTRGVSAVETILTLDRLRQNVSVKEMITAKGKMAEGRAMRKTVSVPNFTNMMSNSMSLDNISSMAIRSSESFQELNLELAGRNRKSLPSSSQHQPEDPIKPFGLETVPETDAADCDNVGSTSPGNTVLKRPARMSTLHEEKPVAGMTTLHEEKPVLKEGAPVKEEGEEDKQTQEQVDSSLTTEVAKPGAEVSAEMARPPTRLPTSQTYESFNELQPKTGTPSLVSSGYGSQAVSSTTLSSEDSLSVRSISVDDTPDTENHLAEPRVVAGAMLQLGHDADSGAGLQLGHDTDSYLLSPPDVSLTSISPGEDTDHTVTVETTPSSANITPSQSVEAVGKEQPGTVKKDNAKDNSEAGVVRRQGGRRAANNPNRSSCPTSLSAQSCLNAGSDTNLRNNMRSEMNLRNDTGSDTNLQRPAMAANSGDTNLKSKNNLEPKLGSKNGSDSNLVYNDGSDSNLSNTSSDRLNCTDDEEFVSPEISNVDLSSLPDWISLGESVQIRPSNYSGVIAYIGGTEFAPGPWIGVELDTPQGKNDGSVKGVRYFSCPAKRGMFVKSQKLNLDKRGREMRLRRQNSSMETSINSTMRKSVSKGGLTSSKSRNKL